MCTHLDSLLRHANWLRVELYFENCTFLSVVYEKEFRKDKWWKQMKENKGEEKTL